jgi:WD40 repeat protein
VNPRLELHIGHTSTVSQLCFSPDGRLLASSGCDGAVILWDAATGEQLRMAHRERTGYDAALCFSPDGTELLTADYRVRRWDVATGRCLRTYRRRWGPAAFTPDGRHIVARCADSFERFDARTGRRIDAVDLGLEPSERPQLVRLAPDGAAAAIHGYYPYSENEVRVVYPETGTVVSFSFPETSSGSNLAVSHGGSLVAVDGPSGLWLYDLRGITVRRLQPLVEDMLGRSLSRVDPERLSEDDIGWLGFGPDDQLLAGMLLGRVVRWRCENGQRLPDIADAEEGPAVTSAAMSPDGITLAIGTDEKSIELWGATSCERIRRLRSLDFEATRLAFSPDGGILAVAYDNRRVLLWNAATGELLREVEPTPVRIEELVFSPDGKSILTSRFLPATRWELSSGRLVEVHQTSSVERRARVLSPDGLLAARSLDADVSRRRPSIELLDARSMEPIRSLPAVPRSPGNHVAMSLDFSPDGRLLASGDWDHGFHLWNVPNARHLQYVFAPEGTGVVVRFSPDGTSIATGGQSCARLWNVKTGKQRAVYAGHTHTVNAVAFSPNSRLLATASADASVKVWETATGRLLATLLRLPAESEAGPPEWLSYTPAGHYAASPGAACFIRCHQGDEVLTCAAFESQFHRPELVAAALR